MATTKIKPQKIKKAVLDFSNDLGKIETTMVEQIKPGKGTVLSYSKMEFEGDAVQYVKKDCSHELLQFHKEVLLTSTRGRRAFWKFVAKAIG